MKNLQIKTRQNSPSRNHQFFQPAKQPPLRVSTAVVSHLYKTMPNNFPQQVAKMQLNAGYKADNWGVATFNQLFNVQQGASIIQSLVNGRRSLFNFDKPINEVNVEDIENFKASYNEGKLAPGISTFFTTPYAFSSNLIHDQYIKDYSKHYHNFTQVAPPRCKETGEIKFPLRQTLGVFTIPPYLGDIPIAVSEVKANDKLAFQLNNGEIFHYDVGRVIN